MQKEAIVSSHRDVVSRLCACEMVPPFKEPVAAAVLGVPGLEPGAGGGVTRPSSAEETFVILDP